MPTFPVIPLGLFLFWQTKFTIQGWALPLYFFIIRSREEGGNPVSTKRDTCTCVRQGNPAHPEWQYLYHQKFMGLLWSFHSPARTLHINTYRTIALRMSPNRCASRNEKILVVRQNENEFFQRKDKNQYGVPIFLEWTITVVWAAWLQERSRRWAGTGICGKG